MSAVPLLDRLETNGQDGPSDPAAINTEELVDPVAWTHKGWTRDRDAVRAALVRTESAPSRIERWDECGGRLWIVESIDTPGTYRIRRSYCHDRFCKVCGSARAARIGANLAEKISTRVHRLITLTLRSTSEPLGLLLDQLYQGFHDLRRTPIWKSRIRGGVAFCEIKYNRKLERWHPHLHIIAEGSFIRQGELSEAWRSVTNDSFITDVRLIRNPEKAVSYVTKYASKPMSSSYLRLPSRLDEAIVAMRGRRLCTAFGNWRGWKLTEAPEDGSWTWIEPLPDVVAKARDGSVYHIRLLQLLAVKPGFDLVIPEPRPPPTPRQRLMHWTEPPSMDHAR